VSQPAPPAPGAEAAIGRPLARAFRALRNYNYRLYWLGLLVSGTGGWMQNVAVAWSVLILTNSAIAVGAIGAIQFLPVLLGAPLAGAVVDRLPKRRLLIATQVGMLAIAVTLAVLAGSHRLQAWHLFVLVFLQGIGNVFDNPTRQSFLVEMVGRTDLPNAVALNSAQFQSARMLGPALAGVIIATVGTALCFVLNALSFVAFLSALALMRTDELRPSRRTAQRRSLFAEVAQAVAYVARTPRLRLPLALMAVIGTFGFNINVLLPLLARNELGVGARGFGFLGSAMGFGSLLAALALAYVGRANRSLLLGSSLVFAVLEVSLGASHNFTLSAALLIVLGMAGLGYAATTQSLVQLGAPDEMRGRIMSFYTLVFLGTSPIGNLFAGGIANRWGALTAFTVCGAISLGAAVVATGNVVLRAARRL
jgi:MFS family permease